MILAQKRDAGYYAVIPASVRYNEELPANAKLLYGELTALCGRDGYCWATNDYFAALYGVAPGSITRWVAALEKMGLIRSEMVATDKGSERRIYAGLFVVTEGGVHKNDEGGVHKNVDTPLNKNDEGGVHKNVETPKGNIFNINNKTMNNTPHNPPKGGACADAKKPRYEHKDTAEWKPERFEKFWKYYHSIAPKIKSGRQATIRAWDKLRPDDDLIAKMGAALEILRNTDQWRRGIGIPHASTWLNDSRWESVDPETDVDDEPYHNEAPVLTAEDSPYQRWSREWEREHGEG